MQEIQVIKVCEITVTKMLYLPWCTQRILHLLNDHFRFTSENDDHRVHNS